MVGLGRTPHTSGLSHVTLWTDRLTNGTIGDKCHCSNCTSGHLGHLYDCYTLANPLGTRQPIAAFRVVFLARPLASKQMSQYACLLVRYVS